MSDVVWIVGLLLAGLAMMVLEVFVPSGGVLGFLSVVALLAGIATAFVEQGVSVGVTVLAATFVAVPVVLAVAFRWFPETPMGRRVIPPPPRPDDVLPDVDRRAVARGLVGRRGRAGSELLPWGIVEVDDLTLEGVSEGGPIAAGLPVDVVASQGSAVVVRAVPVPIGSRADGLRPADSGPGRPPAAAGLERALEEFDFEVLRKGSGPARSLDSGRAANES